MPHVSRAGIPAILLSLFAFSALNLPAAAQEGDAAAGKKVFGKCQACHQLGESARNTVGPQLNGLARRAVGSVQGYRYSKALAAAGGRWTDTRLAAFLAAPRTAVPGTKMAFAGLRNADDIRNLIAYLSGFEASGAQVN
ncbi:c-type cytochrome [Paroceanicella profunda]|uniref:C-type cytochrome n=1 Tax=Paroceanicella profunda TaxID=2579971 RepID=A0A5B8FXC3_9RHOB|nr:c-type cytochrome [Paroceanicella profunda]QDL90743.1 c-type cytochrome [Paroceanicella profunda]